MMLAHGTAEPEPVVGKPHQGSNWLASGQTWHASFRSNQPWLHRAGGTTSQSPRHQGRWSGYGLTKTVHHTWRMALHTLTSNAKLQDTTPQC